MTTTINAATDLFGYTDSSGSSYLDLSANFVVADGWTLGAHAGKQWIDGNGALAGRFLISSPPPSAGPNA